MTNVDVKHACSFTGHRPEKLDAPEADVKMWLVEKIRQAISDGYTDFITGMQKGVDLWAAEILLRLKENGADIRIIAACAFEGMDKSWKGDWRSLFDATISAAAEVNYISQHPGKAAYIIRDKWMIDHSTRLIAVSTGAPGGTQKTIDYATKKRIDIVRYKR